MTDLSISEQQFAVQQTLQELSKLFIIKMCVSLQLLAREAVNLQDNQQKYEYSTFIMHTFLNITPVQIINYILLL